MKKMQKMVRVINMWFVTVILFFFYLLIVPIGRLFYSIYSLFQKKYVSSYWQEPDKRKLDFDSPY